MALYHVAVMNVRREDEYRGVFTVSIRVSGLTVITRAPSLGAPSVTPRSVETRAGPVNRNST
jgi:hypothetical protein